MKFIDYDYLATIQPYKLWEASDPNTDKPGQMSLTCRTQEQSNFSDKNVAEMSTSTNVSTSVRAYFHTMYA